MTDTQTYEQSTTDDAGPRDGLAFALANAPTDTLERTLRELRREVADHAGTMRAASWGGIGVRSAVRYEMAAARKRLAEQMLAAVAAELTGRRGHA